MIKLFSESCCVLNTIRDLRARHVPVTDRAFLEKLVRNNVSITPSEHIHNWSAWEMRKERWRVQEDKDFSGMYYEPKLTRDQVFKMRRSEEEVMG